MNTVELLKVAAVVDSTPDSEWDMSQWLCGSVGCAIGNYCKAYPESPLKIVKSVWSYVPVPSFDDNDGFYAIGEYFRIPCSDAEYLFGPEEYRDDPYADPIPPVTRQEVSDRIRKYVKENQ